MNPTGELHVTVERDDDGHLVSISTEWTGGDVIAMSRELYEHADPAIIQIDGNKVTIGEHEMSIVAECPSVLYLRRIE